jgi:hypothetical protein
VNDVSLLINVKQNNSQSEKIAFHESMLLPCRKRDPSVALIAGMNFVASEMIF